MISVIIPIYNAANGIRQCIESVLAQTYQNFELLLINDGSTDESEQICRLYAESDERIRYFARQNAGVGATRNFGIKESRGEIICFIDADDRVTPQYLEAFQPDTSEADVVISGIQYWNINTNMPMREVKFNNAYIDLKYNGTGIKDFLLVGFPYGKAYKKKILEQQQIIFPENISFHEDHVFVLDYYMHCNSIAATSEVTYIYNVDYNAASLSKKSHDWNKLYLSSYYMFERINLLKRKFSLSHDDIKAALTFCYEPMIGAVYSLYDSTLSSKEKREVLTNILIGQYPISQNYFPHDKKGKLIKVLSSILPIRGMHYFFQFVNKYQNRRK